MEPPPPTNEGQSPRRHRTQHLGKPTCQISHKSAVWIQRFPLNPNCVFPLFFFFSSLNAFQGTNSLVCLAEYGYGSPIADAIYLWNPSIRKYKRLPDFSLTQYQWVSTGFAYQSEANDYKVVKITQMGAQTPWG